MLNSTQVIEAATILQNIRAHEQRIDAIQQAALVCPPVYSIGGQDVCGHEIVSAPQEYYDRICKAAIVADVRKEIDTLRSKLRLMGVNPDEGLFAPPFVGSEWSARPTTIATATQPMPISEAAQ